MITLFGKPLSYWQVLGDRAESLNVSGLLDEIATLRAKVSFYEDRLEQINQFRGIVK